MALCEKCGAQLSDGASFCAICGQSQSQTKTQVDSVPTFAPPTPSFAPPAQSKPRRNGSACYYHSDEPAAARCVKCGKNLCKDCFDSYGVKSGQYAGQALCYDCTQQLVTDNVEALKANKAEIAVTFILTLIGMVIGAIAGASIGAENGSVGLWLFLGMCIGGCFWTFIKGWFSRIGDAISGGGFNLTSILIGFFLGFIIEAVVSVFRTINKVIECLVYLKKTSGFIESDSAALQQMADYMEYTLIRNQNRGVDINTLLSQKSELANNSYAQMVHDQGEAQAEANLRGCVASINENGEIIRNFAA